VRKISIKRWR